MSQTIPGTFILGPSKTGLAIGYRVLNLDRTTYSAFSTSGVSESAIAGTYYKASGIVAPDAGGYVVVGVSGTDYAEGEILPAVPTVAAIQSGLATSSALMTVDGNVTAIKAKTDNLPTDPADESLLEAAITAATSGLSTLTTSDIDARLDAYDAATGTEAAAILAAIAALNNLSSAGAQAAAAAALAAYNAATGTDVAAIAATVAAANPDSVDGATITMRQAVTFDGTLSGLGAIIPGAWTKAIFTVKNTTWLPDSQAVMQVQVSNPSSGSDGLILLNGASSTPANASLTVNQGAGTVAIHIEDDALAAVAADSYQYDLKFYYGTSDSVATAPATCTVNDVVTQAV